MKKLVIFDLDGVLIDSRDLHYDVLNQAIYAVGEEYVITRKEHLTKYDGLSTRQKLAKLTSEKGLPVESHDAIWTSKQDLTFAALDVFVKEDPKLVSIFKSLKSAGYLTAVVSNSIKKTIDIVVCNSGIDDYVDLIVSNEDVAFPKPNPEIYLYSMSYFGISPHDTFIFEDSYIGRQAAFSSGAKVCALNNSTELTMDYVTECLESYAPKKLKWCNKKLNVLIPMAGEGSRFANAHYTMPKPLIDVNGKPMIQTVVDNLNIDANFIFLVRTQHNTKYNLSEIMPTLFTGCKLVMVDQLTEGAACTTLLAKDLIDNDAPLLIANADQFLVWDSCEFYHSVNSTVDGSIVTFNAEGNKWSYVKTDSDGNVTDVAEKVQISNHGSVGVYYFAHGSDYVKYAERMIIKDIRYGQNFNGKGEFYVAPVYNEAIADGKVIKTFDVDQMFGLGTPEDLTYFLETHKA